MLVGVLVIVLFTAVVQLALVLHMRNVVVASATEGARAAANADLDCAAGVDRAAEMVASSLSRRVASDLSVASCAEVVRDGVRFVELRLEARLPLTFFPGGAVHIDTVGHAVREGPSGAR